MQNIRRCSGAILYRYDERWQEYEVLLVKTRNFGAFYIIPGGKVEEIDTGETIEERMKQCAMREINEEVRLGIREMRYLGIYYKSGRDIGYKDPEQDFEFHDFIGEAVGELNMLEILAANNEITYAGFHRQRDLAGLLIEPALKAQIQRCYTENQFQK